jgi:hypothetical protein
MTKGKFWLRLVPLDDNAGCFDIGPETKSGYYPNDSRAYEAAQEVLKEHKKIYIMKLDNFGECFHDVMSLYITYN